MMMPDKIIAKISYGPVTLISIDDRIVDASEFSSSDFAQFFESEGIVEIEDYLGRAPVAEFVTALNEDGASQEERNVAKQANDLAISMATEASCRFKKENMIDQLRTAIKDEEDRGLSFGAKKRRSRHESLTGRRVYVRKGVMHVCSSGRVFGAPSATICIKNDLVTVGQPRSDMTVTVTIIRNGEALGEESWSERDKSTLVLISPSL